MPPGHAEEKLVLVPHRPGRRIRRFLILTGFSVASGLGGFLMGKTQMAYLYRVAVDVREQLDARVEQLDQENETLRQQVANLERSGVIERQASVGVQQTIKGLQDEVNQLRADVSFYKNIMAPSGDVDGLQVQKLDITPVSGGRYAYKLVLAQVGASKSQVEGVVAVSLIGSRNGEREVLSLRDVSDVQSLGVKFKFRYYQDFTGEMVVPADFQPESVQVVAQASGKRGARVEAAFPWQTAETKSNVGKKQG